MGDFVDDKRHGQGTYTCKLFFPHFFWEIPNFLRGQFLKEKNSGKRRLHVLVLCFVCVSHKNL